MDEASAAQRHRDGLLPVLRSPAGCPRGPLRRALRPAQAEALSFMLHRERHAPADGKARPGGSVVHPLRRGFALDYGSAVSYDDGSESEDDEGDKENGSPPASTNAKVIHFTLPPMAPKIGSAAHSAHRPLPAAFCFADARGGIVADHRGCGSTVALIVLFCATKGVAPSPPEGGKHKTLTDAAGKSFYEPHVAGDARATRSKSSSSAVPSSPTPDAGYLRPATLIVAPRPRVAHWLAEMHASCAEAGLRACVCDGHNGSGLSSPAGAAAAPLSPEEAAARGADVVIVPHDVVIVPHDVACDVLGGGSGSDSGAGGGGSGNSGSGAGGGGGGGAAPATRWLRLVVELPHLLGATALRATLLVAAERSWAVGPLPDDPGALRAAAAVAARGEPLADAGTFAACVEGPLQSGDPVGFETLVAFASRLVLRRTAAQAAATQPQRAPAPKEAAGGSTTPVPPLCVDLTHLLVSPKPANRAEPDVVDLISP